MMQADWVSKEMASKSDIYIPMFTSALFTTAKIMHKPVWHQQMNG